MMVKKNNVKAASSQMRSGLKYHGLVYETKHTADNKCFYRTVQNIQNILQFKLYGGF
jgi:hypothetical protein